MSWTFSIVPDPTRHIDPAHRPRARSVSGLAMRSLVTFGDSERGFGSAGCPGRFTNTGLRDRLAKDLRKTKRVTSQPLENAFARLRGPKRVQEVFQPVHGGMTLCKAVATCFTCLRYMNWPPAKTLRLASNSFVVISSGVSEKDLEKVCVQTQSVTALLSSTATILAWRFPCLQTWLVRSAFTV